MEYLQELGYLGLFISSFLSATLIPLSPEIVLSVLIAKGFSIPISIFIATMGNWFGSILTYYIGKIGDWKKIERGKVRQRIIVSTMPVARLTIVYCVRVIDSASNTFGSLSAV